ncbi:hypothetical protein BU16DRAFT_585838 [Lophium mytilinum]|uniref:Aminoglycoside phosphotransferase domain-containing protein n=1 Tax=Lophium mytilinum TaxID=390894 RepID=A0A6A6QBX8_9PEZI|nr:hypothetical protein BU16DRAFT_585838 [Lophium mytilinum]
MADVAPGSPQSPEDSSAFSGYKWTAIESLDPENFSEALALRSLETVDWDALLNYATQKRDGVPCSLFPDNIAMGGSQLVRLIQFEDQKQWIAKLRMPSSELCDEPYGIQWSLAGGNTLCEVAINALLRERTSIPVPEIYAYEMEDEYGVHAPFMLMEAMEGNTVPDLTGTPGVPEEHFADFMERIAEIHVELSQLQMPEIGAIASKDPDGTYTQAPTWFGGPYSTATSFFHAWAAAHRTYALSETKIRACAPPEYGDALVESAKNFPAAIQELAPKISARDSGPFPIHHPDLGTWNILVDDNFKLVGIIDWDAAFAAPWEVFAQFPLFIYGVPRQLDYPGWYDDKGNPTDPEIIEKYEKRKRYIDAVKRAEDKMGMGGDGEGYLLSVALEDTQRRDIGAAMHIFSDAARPGFFMKLMEELDLG